VVTTSDFEAVPRPELMVGADDVDWIRKDSDYKLVDSRSAIRFRGEEERLDPVAGHIPGAVSLPFEENLTADGFFRDREELRQRFEDVVGDTTPEHVIFYCGSGVTAAHNILAFVHSGLGEPRLYPGSWSEWIADSDRPVAGGG
ncbi:MAG: rhodanese-like domain-containing protein, partial [Gemmatimonadota bacterium]|nr:rhodanese-like domain-containing protein [Gemmatimonadota bacterium]